MCDFGYKLQGSSYRLCQPNNTWSGNRVQCNILHCPVLMSNEDSIITYPCDTAYQSECNIHCSPRYYNPFDGMDSMMCALQQPVENNTVGWTQRPECQGAYLLYIHTYMNNQSDNQTTSVHNLKKYAVYRTSYIYISCNYNNTYLIFST